MAGQNELNIHDYLDATSQASARTRTVVIVLVVSSVLTGVGILNSIPENWPLYRVQESAKLNSDYVKEKLDVGSPDRAAYERIADDLIIKEHVTEPDKMSKIRKDAEEKYKRDEATYRQRLSDFYTEAVRAFVDTAHIVRVPFFGIAFDINDLGLLSGVAFFAVLAWFRVSLSREVENLKLSLAQAHKEGCLEHFYHLLAMRQVFTAPTKIGMPQSKRAANLSMLMPVFICSLPLQIYSVLFWTDYRTRRIGNELDPLRTRWLLYVEFGFLALVLGLTIWVVWKWYRIYWEWRFYWKILRAQSDVEEPTHPLLDLHLTSMEEKKAQFRDEKYITLRSRENIFGISNERANGNTRLSWVTTLIKKRRSLRLAGLSRRMRFVETTDVLFACFYGRQARGKVVVNAKDLKAGPCGILGRPTGVLVKVEASILEEVPEPVDDSLSKKYRFNKRLSDWLSRILHRERVWVDIKIIS